MTDAPTPAEVEAIAEVLAAHEDFGLYVEYGGDTHYVCSCDKTKRPGRHRAHLAAALLASPALADLLARARGEAIHEALHDAADDLAPLVDSQHPDALNPDAWLRDRADRQEPHQ